MANSAKKAQGQTGPVKIVAGVDVGNGYTKAAIQVEGEKERRIVDIQSAAAPTTSERLATEPSPAFMANLADHLDATVEGPGVKSRDSLRMFFGAKAVKSRDNTMAFDINDREPKSSDSLSFLLLADVIASAAVDSVWKRTGEVPLTVDVEAQVATALPIGDFIEHNQEFANTLMSAPAVVTVHNFKAPCVVTIRYTAVQVGAEGVVGNYALFKGGPKFFDALLGECRAQGQRIHESVNGSALFDTYSFIGVDIGDGTTNFPVFMDNDIDVDLSGSMTQGFGTILERVVEDSSHEKSAFEDRKDLSEFLLNPNLPATAQQRRRKYQGYVDQKAQVFARAIQDDFSRIWRRVGNRVGAVYVYGGGAGPMRKHLEPLLLESVDMGDETSIPVVFVPEEISRDLNREGLFVMAQNASKAS